MAQRGARVVRGLIAAAAVMTVPLSLAACSSSSGSSGPTTVTVERPAATGNDTDVYNKIFATCEKSTGVKVKFQDTPYDGYLPKVLQQLSSKTMPDVLMLDNGDVQQIAATGALAELKTLGVSVDGYAPGAIAASTYKGKTYALQPIANTIALFYNPDKLKAAGVEVPKTWDELKAAAAKLHQGNTYGIAFSAPNTDEGTWQFLPFMWSNGGDEKKIDSSETAGALQLWTDLVKSGSASSSVVNWSQADVNDQFTAGNAAMMINGPWQIAALKKANVKFEIAPIPAPKSGDKVQSPLGGETWSVPNTGNRDKMAAAAKIVSCIGEDKNQLANAEGRDLVPTKIALKDQFISADPEMKGFAEMVAGLRARTGELGTDWPAASKQIYTAIQLALTGSASPADALTKATQG